MIFRRRVRLSWLRRMREYLWPTMGWRRTGSYLWHRLARLPGSADSAAIGLACGVAISFTPLLGLHIILACVMAVALKANPLAAAIGTLIGNPLTFPIFFSTGATIGFFLFGLDPLGDPDKLPCLGDLFCWPMDWNGVVMFLAMMTGGVILGAGAFVTTFMISRRGIATYQHRRRHLLLEAVKKRLARHKAKTP
ncbi:MAG: DUF2062 domain-containing protein [Pseudomonadota bacterium]|nr:DUF2062 domain-containing protein [Pseudomonadota bacterium]